MLIEYVSFMGGRGGYIKSKLFFYIICFNLYTKFLFVVSSPSETPDHYVDETLLLVKDDGKILPVIFSSPDLKGREVMPSLGICRL